MKRLLFLFLLGAVCNGIPAAAQPKETLTNKSVIDLSKAGLGNALILSKMETSACRFDLSSAKLIELKSAGVSDEVIAAMMDKAAGKTAGSSSSAPKSGVKREASLQMDAVNFVHAVIGGKAVPLEKQVAGMRTRQKALGYGGVSSIYEISGESSPVKIPAASATAFAINTGGAAPDFALYKLKVQKNKRHATAMSANSFTGVKTGEGVLTLSVSKMGGDTYKLTPDQPLAPGEYFFASKAVSSSNSLEVFAFSVE